jgi:NTE family protein
LVTGKLSFIPGSLALSADSSVSSKRWLQTRMIYDNYFLSFHRWKFGIYGDLFLSSQPFFDTYQSTILSVPQFEPTPESSTLFLPHYRAHSFAGVGFKSVFNLFSNLQLRAEGYIYQPVQEIVQNSLGNARYGEALDKRYLIGNAGIVFHNPLGPVSLQVSYFQGREKPISVLFNFGYILFNRRTLK